MDKYKPKAIDELIGNKDSINKVKNWLESWKTKPPQKRAVLMSGQAGLGKTTTAAVLANACGFNPIEFNASDTR